MLPNVLFMNSITCFIYTYLINSLRKTLNCYMLWFILNNMSVYHYITVFTLQVYSVNKCQIHRKLLDASCINRLFNSKTQYTNLSMKNTVTSCMPSKCQIVCKRPTIFLYVLVLLFWFSCFLSTHNTRWLGTKNLSK